MASWPYQRRARLVYAPFTETAVNKLYLDFRRISRNSIKIVFQNRRNFSLIQRN